MISALFVIAALNCILIFSGNINCVRGRVEQFQLCVTYMNKIISVHMYVRTCNKIYNYVHLFDKTFLRYNNNNK